MSDYCCDSKCESAPIPTGWQCPCCKVVYAPNVAWCFCCVEDEGAKATAPVNIPYVSEPPAVTTPFSDPWFFTFQPPPSFTTVSLTIEASHAAG